MARPRSDGSASRQPIKKKFTDAFVSALKPEDRIFTADDTHQRGLALRVQPQGKKTWTCLYYVSGGQSRWYTIGDAAAIGLADARKLANRIMYRAAEGGDPHAERK